MIAEWRSRISPPGRVRLRLAGHRRKPRGQDIDYPYLAKTGQFRENMWTESVTVGSRGLVETLKSKLGVMAKPRRFSGTHDEPTLREPQVGLQR
jgi:hypothetical protein